MEDDKNINLEQISEDVEDASINKNEIVESDNNNSDTKWNLILKHVNKRESLYQTALSDFQESHNRARKSITEARRQSSAIGFLPAAPSIVVSEIVSKSDEDLTDVGLNSARSFAVLLSMKDNESENYLNDPVTV